MRLILGMNDIPYALKVPEELKSPTRYALDVGSAFTPNADPPAITFPSPFVKVQTGTAENSPLVKFNV